MTTDVALVSRVTVSEVSVSVTSAYGGAGQTVANTTKSTSVQLINDSSKNEVFYQVDAGSFVEVRAGESGTFAIDLSTQTLKLKKGAQASTAVPVRLEISGAASGLYDANGNAVTALGIGGAPAATAALDVQSTTKGLLVPRMTSTQRDAIVSPAEGLIIYNTTTHKLNVRAASAWEAVTSA
jgi:hypothetical protein